MLCVLRAIGRHPCLNLIRLLSFLVSASGLASIIVYAFLGGQPQSWTFPAALSLALIILGGVACLASLRPDEEEEAVEVELEKGERGECICIWASLSYANLSSPAEFHQVCVRHDETIEWERGDVVTRVESASESHVVQSKTCLCCLEDFQPSSQLALLPCGHVFHEECIACWSVSLSASARCCPTCRKSYGLGANV
ncbi:Rnf103 [Symbiodinium natans]|uniref:Rnf103 protein n=1 Tax=Symbiodinium natans TaxID=878477 RepID=A0A812UWT1_9DINO|nr:Rnf103 [Symbiodinium natans]